MPQRAPLRSDSNIALARLRLQLQERKSAEQVSATTLWLCGLICTLGLVLCWAFGAG